MATSENQISKAHKLLAGDIQDGEFPIWSDGLSIVVTNFRVLEFQGIVKVRLVFEVAVEDVERTEYKYNFKEFGIKLHLKTGAAHLLKNQLKPQFNGLNEALQAAQSGDTSSSLRLTQAVTAEKRKQEISANFPEALEQIGVKKDKKVDKLLSLLSEVSSAISANDDEAALSSLHRASAEVKSAFVVGGAKKYKQFLAAVSMDSRVTEVLGSVGILESDFEGSNYSFIEQLKSDVFAGFADFLLVSEHLISDGTRCYRLSRSTECAVVNEGSNTKQTVYAGQTLTGGASILLGKLPDFKKVGQDGRKALFVAVDNNWEVSIPLNPEKTADAQRMALRIKKRVEELAAASPNAKSEARDMSGTDDITSQLMKLSEMHQAGALTDDEWVAAKKRLLG